MAGQACPQASESCELYSFTWPATLVLIGLLLVAVGVFWYWWRLPSRQFRHEDASSPDEKPTQEGYVDSRERLDLLRAGRRWGDVSTTDPAYLRRRQTHRSD